MKTWQALSEIAELIEPESNNRADFIKECNSGKLDGVVAVYRTSWGCAGNWDQELISQLPKSIKFCASLGAGYDQIDVNACSAREPPIWVSNTPTAVDDATADTAVFLILGALRGLNSPLFALREGKWR